MSSAIDRQSQLLEYGFQTEENHISLWLNQHRCLETGKKAFLTYQPLPPGKRSIQVHQACLDVLKLIAPPDPSTDIFPITFDDSSHELPSPNAQREGEGLTGLDYNLLISWSLPKWAGSFLWSESPPPTPTPFNVNIRGVNLLGYVKTSTPSVETWRGLSSQRKRWHITRSHLLPCDLISPLELGTPESVTTAWSNGSQRSDLLDLPDELLLLITGCLDDESIDKLRQTGVRLRSLNLGTNYWSERTLTSAKSLGQDLAGVYRTRSCQGGLKPGDVPPGWTTSFLDPLQAALNCHPAIDVWQWWMYSLGWRSRRRIWRCAIEATAAVQFADWLSIV